MAITILQYPHFITPSANKQTFTFSGSSSSNEGYQYVVDIFNSGMTEYIGRFFVPRWPNANGIGVFDVQNVMQDLIKPEKDFWRPQHWARQSDNSYFNYQLAIGEQFDKWVFDDYFFATGSKLMLSSATQMHDFQAGESVVVKMDPSNIHPNYNGKKVILSVPDAYSIVVDEDFFSGPTVGGKVSHADGRPILITGQTISSAITTYACAVQAWEDIKLVDYDPADWVIGYNLPLKKQVSTMAQFPMTLDASQHFYLFVPSLRQECTGYKIQTKDAAGETIGYYEVFFDYLDQEWIPSWMPIGPYNIANLNPQYYQVMDSGPSAITMSDVSWYQLFLTNSNENQLSDFIRINIDRSCVRDGSFELLFRDRRNTYGSFLFNNKFDDEVSIQRSNYRKATNGLLNTFGGNYNNRPDHRGLDTYNVTANQEYDLRITLRNAAENEYFRDFLMSSSIYWIREGKLCPVVIQGGTYRIINEEEGVYQYTVRMILSNRITLIQ